jgi:PAS domain S-box-containing protein
MRNPPELRRLECANHGRAQKRATLSEFKKLAALTSEIAVALTRSSDLRTSLQRCAEVLVRGLDAAFARIWALNDNEQVLQLEASAGLYTHINGPHSRVPVGQLKIGLIAQEGKPQFTNAVLGDPRVNDQEWARREGMVAFAGHPLICADRVVGVMALFSRRPLTRRVYRALAMVADSIAHRIAHGRSVEALRLSEERFALAVQGTDEGIWDWNIVTNEVYMAPRFKELLGYDVHELESHFATFESRLHAGDRERILRAVADHLQRRQPYRVEFRLRVKSGEFRWFHARGQALWDATGKATRMLGSITDITRRKVNEQRQAAVHQVTEILASTTEFTALMPRLLKAVGANLDWSVGMYWAVDRQADVLRCVEFWQAPSWSVPTLAQVSQAMTFPRGVGLPGRTWAGKRREWIEDVTQDANFPRAAAALQDNLHGAIAFPILIGDEVHGVMEFFNSAIQILDEALLQNLDDISQHITRYLDLQQSQEVVRQHQHELAIARGIQQHLFPAVMPILPGFEFAGASQPAHATGGDYFDFIPFPNGHLMLAIGDVSGHGLGAAMLMTEARAYLRALALTGMHIDTILNFANARLVEDTNDEFVTMFLGLLNPFGHSLIYHNAGHWPGYLFDAHGEVKNVLASSDLPLGIELQTYQRSSAALLTPGDLLLLVTDGVVDAFSPDGVAFGMANVLETVRAARALAPDAIIATLFAKVRQFAQQTLADDMTAIVVKVA